MSRDQLVMRLLSSEAGIDSQKLLLEMDGHIVIQKGKRYFVDGYDEKLVEL